MLTINPINSVNSYNSNFKSYKHAVTSKTGKLLYRGDTCFFRHDLDFDGLIYFISTKYQSVPKVNFIAHACSDGEEIYSIVARMLDLLGINNVKKFLPINAKDIDEEHIKKAKSGQYTIESYERGAIDFYMGNRFTNYFNQKKTNIFNAKEILKNKVIFRQSNILEDVNKIDFHNTILLARNFWPYLDYEDANLLALKLSLKTDKSSTLVIGDYDKESDTNKILEKYGFKESADIENIFEKIK